MLAQGIFGRPNTLGLGWTFTDIAAGAKEAAKKGQKTTLGPALPVIVGGLAWLLTRKPMIAAIAGGAAWFATRPRA